MNSVSYPRQAPVTPTPSYPHEAYFGLPFHGKEITMSEVDESAAEVEEAAAQDDSAAEESAEESADEGASEAE